MIIRVALLLCSSGFPLSAGLASLDSRGYQTMLRASRGHVLLVSFWATWCQPCRDDLPLLRQLSQRSKLRLVTILADEPENQPLARQLLKSERLGHRAYQAVPADSGQLINGVDPEWNGVLPALFVYDRSGNLIQRFHGEIEWNRLRGLTHR